MLRSLLFSKRAPKMAQKSKKVFFCICKKKDRCKRFEEKKKYT